ncbi:hypothetical protein B0H10DRAFT_269544 [Mycena sp. CBHHK59/15]|nr:hypothetical protein B0H10DRAFT_269544 [Mycena sp. CBHHK59/15]
MASQPGPNASSAQIPSVASPSPSSTMTSQRASSQTAASSVASSSLATSPSSKISASASSRPQSTSTSPTNFLPSPSISPSPSNPSQSTSTSPTNFFRSTSISQSPSNPSQIPSHASTDAQVAPLSHRPAIIAAVSASIAAVLLFVFFLFFLYRRRRARQKQLGSITLQDHSFLREHSGDDDDKGWKDSARSTAGSGWPEESPACTIPIPLHVEEVQTRQSVSSFSGKAPHYTVRSHASMSDVYGFGQDVAWQEAHYEDPLPVVATPDRAAYPAIDVIPPTPPSGIIHHNTASAMPLLRSHSAASSISSEYSTASMVLPDSSEPSNIAGPPTPALIHDRALSMDDREWIACTRDSPPDGQGARRLV